MLGSEEIDIFSIKPRHLELLESSLKDAAGFLINGNLEGLESLVVVLVGSVSYSCSNTCTSSREEFLSIIFSS